VSTAAATTSSTPPPTTAAPKVPPFASSLTSRPTDAAARSSWLSSVDADDADASFDARARQFVNRDNVKRDDDDPSRIASSALSVYTVVATGTGTISEEYYTVPTRTPLFPYIVKVEERRLTLGTDNPAVCVQMQLLDDGTLAEVTGVDDIELRENDPKIKDFDDSGEGAMSTRRLLRRGMAGEERAVGKALLRRDEEPDNSCHCQWRNS
jgi:hypothetical protein